MYDHDLGRTDNGEDSRWVVQCELRTDATALAYGHRDSWALFILVLSDPDRPGQLMATVLYVLVIEVCAFMQHATT